MLKQLTKQEKLLSINRINSAFIKKLMNFAHMQQHHFRNINACQMAWYALVFLDVILPNRAMNDPTISSGNIFHCSNLSIIGSFLGH